MKTTTLLAIAATTSTTQAFTTSTSNNVRTQTSLNMGLFDGVKDAFGSSGMGDLTTERETPIDRWMGWNTKADAEQGSVSKGELLLYCCWSFVLL